MKATLALAILALTACTDVQMLGAAAIEKRRVANDIQARATMAATCDIAMGAYFRELTDVEQRYVALVCGGVEFAPDTRPIVVPDALAEARRKTDQAVQDGLEKLAAPRP